MLNRSAATYVVAILLSVTMLGLARVSDADQPAKGAAQEAGASNPATSPFDANAALEAYEGSLEVLNSYDVRVVATHVRKVADKAEKKQFIGRQWLEGEKYRCDVFKEVPGQRAEQKMSTLWNGSTRRIYDSERKTGYLSNDAIDSDLTGSSDVPSYPVLFKMAFGHFDYAKLMRDRTPSAELKGDIVEVDGPPAPREAISLNVHGIRLFLNQKKGFLPERIVWYSVRRDMPGKFVERVHIENQLVEVEPALWLPIESQIHFLNADPNSEKFGKDIETITVQIDRDQSQFNFPLDVEVFSLNFPEGTKVTDDTGKVSDRRSRRK